MQDLLSFKSSTNQSTLTHTKIQNLRKSGDPVPVCNHPLDEERLSDVQPQLPLPQLNTAVWLWVFFGVLFCFYLVCLWLYLHSFSPCPFLGSLLCSVSVYELITEMCC